MTFKYKPEAVRALDLASIQMPHPDRQSQDVRDLYHDHLVERLRDIQRWSYEVALAYRAQFAIDVDPQDLADRIGNLFDEEILSALKAEPEL